MIFSSNDQKICRNVDCSDTCNFRLLSTVSIWEAFEKSLHRDSQRRFSSLKYLEDNSCGITQTSSNFRGVID
jgi:hypothetical protein